MGNSRLYLIVAITLEYLCLGGTRFVPEEFSDHWARCEAILQGSEIRACTQSGDPSCTGRRVPKPDEDVPGYWCNGDSCPTVLSSMGATVYREDLLWTCPGLSWYGVNVSWTINSMGTSQDIERKTFLISAHIGYGKWYFAEIDAQLRETDYINGEATLYYDCIYPISNNQSSTLNIYVRTKPHARGDLQFITVETVPSEKLPKCDVLPGIDKEPREEQTTPPDLIQRDVTQKPVWMYVMSGALGMALICASICMIYVAHKHCICRKNNEQLQKVVILAMNDDAKLKKLNQDFRRRLRRSFQCRIVKLHDMSLKSVVQPYDLLKAEMTSASCIIVVTSERLLDVLARFESSRFGQNRSCDPARIALEIIHRELRLSPTHMSKIVSVQLRGTHIGPSIPYLSPWRYVSLSGSTENLVRFLKGDRDCLESDQTDTMGDTNTPTFNSGVEFSDESSTSNAANMEESSGYTPRSLYGQNTDPPASHSPDSFNPGHAYHHVPDRPSAQHHVLFCPYAQQNMLYNQPGQRQDSACLSYVDVVRNDCARHQNATITLSGPHTVSWKPPVIPHEQSEIGSDEIEYMVHDINSGFF